MFFLVVIGGKSYSGVQSESRHESGLDSQADFGEDPHQILQEDGNQILKFGNLKRSSQFLKSFVPDALEHILQQQLPADSESRLHLSNWVQNIDECLLQHQIKSHQCLKIQEALSLGSPSSALLLSEGWFHSGSSCSLPSLNA